MRMVSIWLNRKQLQVILDGLGALDNTEYCFDDGEGEEVTDDEIYNCHENLTNTVQKIYSVLCKVDEKTKEIK